MNVPRLAVILHGAHWPAGDPGSTWRDRLSRVTGRVVDVVLARDEPTRPQGAGRVLADAVGRTLAPHVLVAEVTATPDDETVRALLAALDAQPAPAVATVGVSGGQPDAPDWPASLLAARDQTTPPAFRAHPLWAVDREGLIDIGGIDRALWSYGIVEDLAARFEAAGRRTVALPLPPVATTTDAYPYAPAFDAFLRWHARLRLDVLHGTADEIGPRLSSTLVALLASAWRATGVQARGVSFGGDWGRASLTTRLRTRLGGPPPDALWPADESGTVVPLAALHAFTLDLPAVVRTDG